MAQVARYWLVKSEPDCFSIQDLANSPQQTTSWDGVRNYQARNFMRDQMRLGDRVLFYHSSTSPPAVVGTAVVAREAYPDHTAWQPGDDHYDPKASPENPIWQMVDIRLEKIFAEPIPIDVLRGTKGLKQMELLRTGSRLSVQPVRASEFKVILNLARGSRSKQSATTKPAKKAKSTKKVARKREGTLATARSKAAKVKRKTRR